MNTALARLYTHVLRLLFLPSKSCPQYIHHIADKNGLGETKGPENKEFLPRDLRDDNFGTISLESKE